jgi:hypothetical protein
MERECFESDDVAALLNRGFVAVKVDKEERPDVDRLYMQYVQATQGGGGWPMSVFLTPELAPFFGGTYFPPEDAAGRPGAGGAEKTCACALPRRKPAWPPALYVWEAHAFAVRTRSRLCGRGCGGAATRCDVVAAALPPP